MPCNRHRKQKRQKICYFFASFRSHLKCKCITNSHSKSRAAAHNTATFVRIPKLRNFWAIRFIRLSFPILDTNGPVLKSTLLNEEYLPKENNTFCGNFYFVFNTLLSDYFAKFSLLKAQNCSTDMIYFFPLPRFLPFLGLLLRPRPFFGMSISVVLLYHITDKTKKNKK